MADNLTASQLAELSQRNIRVRVVRTATLVNDSGSWTLTDEHIKEWGSSKFEVYNKHPNDRGRLRFPTFTLTADNSDGDWDIGGTYFPNGRSDIKSSTITLVVFIEFQDAPNKVVSNFVGRLREPEFDETGIVTLLCEHLLTALTSRKWVRTDRIGGDTGVNHSFDT